MERAQGTGVSVWGAQRHKEAGGKAGSGEAGKTMAPIFWVTCPKCGRRFYCHQELRHRPFALLCPFCNHTFPQEESPELWEASGQLLLQRPQAARSDGPR